MAQVVANIGTWVQITVANWLVLGMSHSGLALGITNALQFGPAVFLGMFGGVIADRCDRRRVLMVTQACLGLIALALGLLASLGSMRIWAIWLAAAALGLVKCFDLPALQGFMKDMVGLADLPSAVALINAVNATGRMIGPVFGGLVLTSLGAAPGFFINAAAFCLVVAVLASLRAEELSRRALAHGERGQIRQGIRYIRIEPLLAVTSVIMVVVFAAAYNFQVSLALIASDVLAGDSRTYGALMSALGMGAVAGSLIAASVQASIPNIILWTLTLAAAQFGVAASHSMHVLLATIFAYGVSASLFSVTVISTLQLHTVEEMRGRVMAWYSICFLGSSPIGAPAFGALAGSIGVSRAFCVTASICAVTALVAAVAWKLRPAANCQ